MPHKVNQPVVVVKSLFFITVPPPLLPALKLAFYERLTIFTLLGNFSNFPTAEGGMANELYVNLVSKNLHSHFHHRIHCLIHNSLCLLSHRKDTQLISEKSGGKNHNKKTCIEMVVDHADHLKGLDHANHSNFHIKQKRKAMKLELLPRNTWQVSSPFAAAAATTAVLFGQQQGSRQSVVFPWLLKNERGVPCVRQYVF